MSADEHLVRQAIAPYVGGGSKVTRAAWRRGDIFDDGPITPPWLAAIAIGRPGNAPGNWNFVSRLEQPGQLQALAAYSHLV